MGCGQTHKLVARHRSLIKLHAGITVALEETLNGDEQIDPHRLRAGISAPGTANSRSDEEQTKTRHEQKTGHIIEFLGPDFDREEVETASSQIEQNALIRRELAAVPAQPRQTEVNAECHPQYHPLEVSELPLCLLGKNTFAGLIKRLNRRLVIFRRSIRAHLRWSYACMKAMPLQGLPYLDLYQAVT